MPDWRRVCVGAASTADSISRRRRAWRLTRRESCEKGANRAAVDKRFRPVLVGCGQHVGVDVDLTHLPAFDCPTVRTPIPRPATIPGAPRWVTGNRQAGSI